MRVLIVEDDLMLGDLLKEYLQHLGHEKVDFCTTGNHASSTIENEQYECAFVDLMLPDIGGLELLTKLKDQNPGMPVIMMSGCPTMEYAIEAMRKGASDFLTKPFNLQDLALTIERVAKERRLLLENLSLQLEHQTRKHVEKLNEELREKIDEQTRLFEISREIEGIRASEHLYPSIVALASRLTEAKKAGFFILSTEPDSLLLISDIGCSPEEQTNRSFRVKSHQVRDVLRSDAPYAIIQNRDLHDDCRFRAFARGGSILSCWPFRIRGELFGFLMTCHNGESKSFTQSDLKLLDFLVKKAALAIENMALYESLVSNFYGILRSLVNALEAKDPYTGKHSERVTNYAVIIADQLSCSATQIESLKTIGYLHDIGKIGIADHILNKPDTLTEEERELIEKHPVIGESIVTELGLSVEERAIIRHHHERWDGNGYPDGLAAQEIELLARIVAVADAFDAMTSKRAYRDIKSREDAIQELRRNAGKQFDPLAVEAFIDKILSRGDI
jgi:putative nucleotidyltransferase with HDIG domain